MPTSDSDSQQNDVAVKLGTLLIAVILNFALYGYVLHQFLSYLEYRYKDSSRLRCCSNHWSPLSSGIPLSHPPELSYWRSSSFTRVEYAYFPGCSILCGNIASYNIRHSSCRGVGEAFSCLLPHSAVLCIQVFLWPFSSSPIVTGVITSFTNVYMINRLYRLTGSKVQMICAAVPAFISPVTGTSVSILSWTTTTHPWRQHASGLSVFSVLVVFVAISQVLSAVLINGLLMRALHKSRSGFLRSDTVISYLIRQAIQTGLFASIFSIANLVTWRCFRTTNVFSIFSLNLGLLDTMAIMESLLSREMLREWIERPNDTDVTLAKQVHPAIVGRPSTGPH